MTCGEKIIWPNRVYKQELDADCRNYSTINNFV